MTARPMPTRVRSAATGLAIALVGAVAATLLYRHTLAYGFDYDDYHFVRPFAGAEIAAAFHGPWDASGIELPYYRPLTIAMFAARFAAFGLNSEAYHIASIAGFALAAALVGLMAWRASDSIAAGGLSAIAFASHPAMPYSLVAWVTNQMHLLEMLLVLCAVLWWLAVRRRSVVWWLPLWILGAATFLVKEDGIMLLPALVVLHFLRRWMVERDLPARWGFAAASAALVVAMIATRSSVLSGPAARAVPHVAQAWTNYVVGLDRVFRLVPATRDWQLGASWFAVLLLVAGLLCARRASPGIRFVMAAGAALAVSFNLPFVFVTKPEQMHVVAAGAALWLGTSGAAVLHAVRPAVAKAGAGLLLATGFTTFALVAVDISHDFAPFAPPVLAHDAIVQGWAAVPHGIREYLAAKRQPGGTSLSPNPADAIDVVTFGVHPRETAPDGVTYNWMSRPRVEIFVNAKAHSLTLPLRHEAGAFREPTDAAIEVDGVQMDRIHFGDGTWHHSRIALRESSIRSLQRMHRVVVSIDHAWVPSSVVPGSGDSRTLGLQIGVIEIR
ncbi:MAG TPA: hypothetical protein VF147_07545 [Vicinamibacterales bacterium]